MVPLAVLAAGGAFVFKVNGVFWSGVDDLAGHDGVTALAMPLPNPGQTRDAFLNGAVAAERNLVLFEFRARVTVLNRCALDSADRTSQ